MVFLKRTLIVLAIITLAGLLFLLASCTKPPLAGFITDKNTIAVNKAVQFTDQSTGEITARSWDFGDGSNSAEANPSHSYANKGSYTASLTVSNKAGSNTKTLAIAVLESPVASFSTDSNTAAVSETIKFNNQSKGNNISYSWDFGDGSAVTEQNPSHAYNKEGRYTVSLKVTSEVGSDTKTSTITVLTAPVAIFQAEKAKVVINEAIKFTDLSKGEVTSRSWDFGDTSTSNKQIPSHAYTKKGNYKVSLTVSNKAGSNTTSTPVTVIEPVKAGFSAVETEAASGSSIKFTDNSSGDIESWSWDFGDGSSSTEQNPSHKFAKAGKYTVALRVKNVGSSDITVKNNYITITNLNIYYTETCSNITSTGARTTRANAVFHRGDTVWIYFSVSGFEQKKADSKVEVWMSWQKLELIDPSGKSLMSILNLYQFHDTTTPIPDMSVGLWGKVGDAESTDPLGEYKVVIAIEDKLSGETATKSIPFTLQ